MYYMDTLNGSSTTSVEESNIKHYLAHWFQLGKKVYSSRNQQLLFPNSVIEQGKYSKEFEDCWRYILSPDSGDCYLEGTEQTIAELLSSQWEIVSCALCEMPIPVRIAGQGSIICPCNDLPNWPNLELPTPRSPVDNAEHLSQIHQRLRRLN